MTRYPLLAVLMLMTGCASYHYNVAQPDGGVSQVVKDQDLVIPASPAELRLRQVSDHCVVLISNPTTQPFALDGGGSTIVDPKGQSRTIASQLIAGQSYRRLILPPMRESNPQEPAFRIGFGMFVDSSAARTPQYLDVNPPTQEYWDWDGSGAVQLILTFRQDNQVTRHQFTIRRTKD